MFGNLWARYDTRPDRTVIAATVKNLTTKRAEVAVEEAEEAEAVEAAEVVEAAEEARVKEATTKTAKITAKNLKELF